MTEVSGKLLHQHVIGMCDGIAFLHTPGWTVRSGSSSHSAPLSAQHLPERWPGVPTRPLATSVVYTALRLPVVCGDGGNPGLVQNGVGRLCRAAWRHRCAGRTAGESARRMQLCHV